MIQKRIIFLLIFNSKVDFLQITHSFKMLIQRNMQSLHFSISLVLPIFLSFPAIMNLIASAIFFPLIPIDSMYFFYLSIEEF